MATQQLLTLSEYASLGLAASAFPLTITDAIKTSHLTAASGVVLGYYAAQFDLPLVTWGDDTRLAVASIANFTLMRLRGFDPSNPADQLLVKGYDDTIAWLKDVARGLVTPADIVDASSGSDDAAPFIESDDVAGWTWPTTSSSEDC